MARRSPTGVVQRTCLYAVERQAEGAEGTEQTVPRPWATVASLSQLRVANEEAQLLQEVFGALRESRLEQGMEDVEAKTGTKIEMACESLMDTVREALMVIGEKNWKEQLKEPQVRALTDKAVRVLREARGSDELVVVQQMEKCIEGLEAVKTFLKKHREWHKGAKEAKMMGLVQPLQDALRWMEGLRIKPHYSVMMLLYKGSLFEELSLEDTLQRLVALKEKIWGRARCRQATRRRGWFSGRARRSSTSSRCTFGAPALRTRTSSARAWRRSWARWRSSAPWGPRWRAWRCWRASCGPCARRS